MSDNHIIDGALNYLADFVENINGAVFEKKVVTSGVVNIPANQYTWATINAPENAVAATGYYLTGTGNTVTLVYAFYLDHATNQAKMALRNTAGSQACALTIEIEFLCVTNTQPIFVDHSMTEDYVIGQGTGSNGWFWRKWNSGKLEQWGLIQPTGKTGTAFGNMYYATYTGITYPIPFTKTPALNVTPYGVTMGVVGGITHTKTGITSYDMYRANAGTVGAAVSCYAIGTWK